MKQPLQKRLIIATLLLTLAAAIFMLWPTARYSPFILELRATKLATLTLLGITGGIATIVFQTVAGNRLLTPSLMGIDSIYLLLQSGLIALIGSQHYNLLNPYAKFAAVSIAAMLTATLLYTVLLQKLRGDIFRLLLIGVIFSVFCRSLVGFITRLLDPTAFAVYQSVAYADINKANTALLSLTAILTALTLTILWQMRHRLDIIALGRNTAISLGIHYQRDTALLLLAITLLVALATALVGPMLFFGLLASALAYRLFPTARHAILIPAAAIIGVIILLFGQLAFEQLFHFGGTLSTAVESLGGLIFLILITRKAAHD